MTEHFEKKETNIPVSMTASTKAKVIAFAEREGVSNAKYCLGILEAHFDKLETEARVTADLLGFHLSNK